MGIIVKSERMALDLDFEFRDHIAKSEFIVIELC